MEQKCPLCQRLLELRKSETPIVIERFKHSTLIVGDHQTFPGYCVLVLNHHVREPHELPAHVQAEVFAELMRVGKAIEKAFNPDKINYACYGNMVPHIHWHVFPRRKSDKNWPEAPWTLMSEFSANATTPEQAAEVRAKIRKALTETGEVD